MSAISHKASVFAVVAEATEGTIVKPASGASFLPIQDDIELSAAIEKKDNAEIKNSIAPSKKITGAENPTAGFSHYVKHSGVEGQAPAWGKIAKACLGAEKVASTEYAAVTGSTVTGIKVSDASVYQVGELLLIKDSTNGYSIRPIDSINETTEVLTLGFTIPAAPAAAVKLGKAISYSPLNDSHGSLTIWRYIGNGGAVDMIRGCKVTGLDIKMDAGEPINCKISMEGLEFYMNPVEIVAATDDTLDFTDSTSTFAATIATGFYKTPNDFAVAVQTAIRAVSADTISVSYSKDTGKYTILSTGTVLSLLWKTGTNTAKSIAPKLGFSTASDSTAALTYTSGSAISLVAPYTPTYDAANPIAAKGHVVLFGDATDNVCFGPSSVSVNISNSKKTIDNICSESGRSGSVMTKRECKISVTALLSKFDADKMDRLLKNKDSRFMYVGGEKSGGNWVPGTCFGIYAPFVSVDDHKIGNADSLATLQFDLSTFGVPGGGEIFLGFV